MCAEDREPAAFAHALLGWLPPEALRPVGNHLHTAGDVFMLGCTLLQILTACERTPYDWLSSEQLLEQRTHDRSWHVGPLQVCGRGVAACRWLTVHWDLNHGSESVQARRTETQPSSLHVPRHEPVHDRP